MSTTSSVEEENFESQPIAKTTEQNLISTVDKDKESFIDLDRDSSSISSSSFDETGGVSFLLIT